MINAPVTAADRAEADRLSKIDWNANNTKIHDLLVSCYVGTGEDGGPEQVHETKISDGTCRCGYNRLRKWGLTLTKGAHTVETFTWGATRSHALRRVWLELDNAVWEGYAFELTPRPIG